MKPISDVFSEALLKGLIVVGCALITIGAVTSILLDLGVLL